MYNNYYVHILAHDRMYMLYTLTVVWQDKDYYFINKFNKHNYNRVDLHLM